MEPAQQPGLSDAAAARAAQKADDFRRWDDYLAGLSGLEPPFAI